ncbi:hypothetical protein Tco_0422387 [Tanacetum coccineum]
MCGGGGCHDPFDIFKSLFGSGGSPFGGGSSRGRRKHRVEDVVHPLKVSLGDLYNGTSKKLSLSGSVLCSKCKKSGASMKCVVKVMSNMKVLRKIPKVQHKAQNREFSLEEIKVCSTGLTLLPMNYKSMEAVEN